MLLFFDGGEVASIMVEVSVFTFDNLEVFGV